VPGGPEGPPWVRERRAVPDVLRPRGPPRPGRLEAGPEVRDVRTEASMSGPAHIARAAWRALLHHAGDVARSSGREAIGWLLGFFVGDEPYVLDAHPATRYKHQSRYGAVADPTEEAEIAVRYPRNVGIVGLYHSHPFKDETRHAIFHSATDDATLKSLAAGATRNRLTIAREDGRYRVELSLHLDPAVFVVGSEEDEVLRATRNEILDDVLFLLWRGFDASAVDLTGVERFEANLGSLSV